MKTWSIWRFRQTAEMPLQSHLHESMVAISCGVTVLLLLGGCEGVQAVLAPHGPEAKRIAAIGWVLFGGATAVFLLVLALTVLALAMPAQRNWLGSSKLIVAGGLVFPIITLGALLIYSLVVARALTAPAPSDAVEIDVVGKQWWWEVHYLDENGNIAFTTANEIRFPTGRPLRARVSAADVIHSFWVPNLAGKIDMIPGHVNELLVEATEPGSFRGQCAEYCGGPHAQMAFYAVAEPAEQFARWFERQSGPAREPETPDLQRGRDLFLSNGCGACHTVRGTPATGRIGPDLTHVGSRRSIGAGILDNNIETLEAWIADSQRFKPNNQMPPFDMLPDEDLRAIAAYLESLK